jgi:hypothetical protein
VGSKIVIAILPEGILETGSAKDKCLAGVGLSGIRLWQDERGSRDLVSKAGLRD